MKTEVKRITFFTKEEYSKLKYKHLPLDKYKLFVKRANELRCSELILRKEGYMLPQNLGLFKVFKHKPLGLIKTAHSYLTKGKDKWEHNLHTFGFIYSFKWLHNYRTEKKLCYYGNKPIDFIAALRLRPHRMLLKRPLAAIIKSNLRDYDERP